MRATQDGDTRVFYRDVKPYDAPARLDELIGPRSGQLTLPHHIYWGPQKSVDLDTEGGIVKAYQAVLREGSTTDQVQLLNRDRLIEIWQELALPGQVRELWESRFPELASVV